MTPTPSPDREPSTVDATLDDVRHFYRLMMEGHPSGAALFDAAASDYMANLLDNDADQDGRPDTAELQRLTEQSKRLTAAQPPVQPSPALQADWPRVWVDAEGDLIVGESAGPTVGLKLGRAMVVYRNYGITDDEAIAALTRPAPSAPVERPDGFAGYTSCPSLPCTGTLAANCAASGDCLVGLALLHLNETCDLQRRTHAAPAPTDGEP